MTSLAQQLKRLALPEGRALATAHKRQRKSLLFDPAEAAGIDRDTFYAIGVNGLQELQGIDPRLHDFEDLLFDEASKLLERSVQTEEFNRKLDKKIRRFLLTVSPYFLLKPAQKAIEWLVYRFHIHEYNIDELMMCILPYHETKVFVRAVQLLNIKDERHKWNWLEPIQKPGVSLSKIALVTHCITDTGFLHFVCQLPVLAIKAHKKTSLVEMDSPPSDFPLRVFFSFYATAIVSAIATPTRIKESFLAPLVPFLLRGLRQSYLDYNGATYMVISQLGVSATLKNSLLEPLMEAMCQHVRPDLLQEMLGCLAVLCHAQNLQQLPGKVMCQLCSMPQFVQSLTALSKSHNILSLLSALLPQLTSAALRAKVVGAESLAEGDGAESPAEGSGQVDMMAILLEILRAVQVEVQIVVSVARCLLDGYVTACHEKKNAQIQRKLKEKIAPVVQGLERRFPEVMDLVVDTYLSEARTPERQESVQDFVSMYSGSAKHQLLPQCNTSLVLSLNHASEGIRKMAVDHIRSLVGKGETVDSFLRDSLIQRLNDDSMDVVFAVLQFDEYLCEILPVDSVFEAVKKLIRGQRRKYESKRRAAMLSAFKIVTSRTWASEAPHLVNESVAMLIPYLFTAATNQATDLQSSVSATIAESHLILTHPVLLGIKEVLVSETAEDPMTTQKLDLLSRNMAALEPDHLDSMVSALLLTLEQLSRSASICLLVETILLRLLQLVANAQTKLDVATKLLGVLVVDVQRTCDKECVPKQKTKVAKSETSENEKRDEILQPVATPSDPIPSMLHDCLTTLVRLKRKRQTSGVVRISRSVVDPMLWILESLVLSTAPVAQSLAPDTKWWTPRLDGGQYVTFMLKLLDLLMLGSTQCQMKDKPCQGYRRIVQSMIKHHFGDLVRFLKLLSIGWMGHVTASEPMGFASSPIFQVRCLKMAAVIFGSVPQESVQRVLKRDSTVVPVLLIALSSPLEPVREVAVQCLLVIRDCCHDDGSSPYFWLVRCLAKKSEELIMDSGYIQQTLGHHLMKTRKDSQTSDVKEVTATRALHCLVVILACVTDDEVIPHHVQTSLLRLLEQVDSEIVLSALLGMLSDLLNQSAVGSLSTDRAHTLQLILGHVTTVTANQMADRQCLDLFLEALSREGPVREGMSAPQGMALDQMNSGFYTAIPSSDIQQTLLSKLIDLQVDTKSSSLASRLAKVMRKLPITASQFITELGKIKTSKTHKSVKDVRKARQKQKQASLEEAPESLISDGRPWQRVTTILEGLQQRKLGRMCDLQTLVPSMFTILSLCLELPPSEQASSEYIKQLLLTTILTICGHLDKAEGQTPAKLKEEQFSVELVVQCIRTSDNSQTHNHALLLLATAAKLFPEHVLHNIMAIFTFMGASLLRQDDSHSFQVIHKTVQTVIPALVKASKDQSLPSSLAGNLEDVVTMVMQTFVDAFPHIPEHRRLPLFNHLVQSVGGAEYLWRVVLLLIGGYVKKGATAMLPEDTEPKGPGRNLEFWVALCHHFDPESQVTSLVEMLAYLGTLKERKVQKTPARTPMWTRSHRDGRRESKVGARDLIFDIEHHTPRQLRHFQFTAVGFLSHLLASDNFIGQLANLSDRESMEMQSLYQKLLEETLCYITHVAHCIHDNEDPNVAKFWRALLHRAYDLLDKVNSLLPAMVFIKVVSGLLTNHLPTIRRKAMELLNNKLIQQKEGFDEEETSMLLGMIDTLVTIARASRDSNVELEELDINRQTALYSLKLLCKLFGGDHHKEFARVMEVALDVMAETESKTQVIASGLLCLAEAVSGLRAHAIPYLSRFVPPLLETLASKTIIASSDLHLLSAVTAVQKTLETLPHFLSPYLRQLIEQVSRLSGARMEEEKAQLTIRLKACRYQLATALPPRVLIPVVTECYKTVVSTNQASIGPLMSVLSDHLDHLSKEDLLSHHHATVGLFILALEYRSAHSQDSLEEVATIEGHVIDALLTMVMKLSEATFRPMYLKLFEWAIRTSDPDRLLTFYRLSDSIAYRLKSIFTLFAGHVITNVAQLLDANNVSKTDKLFFDGSDPIGEEKSTLLVRYLLDCLHKCFLYDKGEFVTKERFETLMQPLVDQIENTRGGDEAYQTRIVDHLTPCLIHFMVAAGDPSTWQPLNYQVLLKTRNSSPKVRYASLTVLHSLHTHLGEDYLSLLPETIPFLAELMEDESEEVEQHCQDVVSELEKTMGEPLQKYF